MAGCATSYQPWLLLCVDIYTGMYVNLGMMQYTCIACLYLLVGWVVESKVDLLVSERVVGRLVGTASSAQFVD